MSEKKSANRIAKEAQLVEIVDLVKAAQSIAIVSYSGLTVAQVTELRKQCRENGAHYVVLKNRLFKLALEQLNIEGAADYLNGPNAFVFSAEDAVAGPKVVKEFIEKNKLESLKVVGGLLEGKAVDATVIDKLASMPSREVLLGRLVGSLANTISGFVRVIEAYRKKQAGEE